MSYVEPDGDYICHTLAPHAPVGTVYLAGQITGKSYDGANDWRIGAKQRLQRHNIEALNPLRCKSYLEGLEKIGHSYPEHIMSSAKAITVRDRFDVLRCDVLLVNVLETEFASIGTVMEIAWADSKRIPTVVVMSESNIHHHPMITETVGWVVPTLEQALDVVEAILLA